MVKYGKLLSLRFLLYPQLKKTQYTYNLNKWPDTLAVSLTLLNHKHC